MKQKKIAGMFEEIADIYEMKGVDFKPRAYRNAAQTLRSIGEPIEDIHERGELKDLPGIGDSTAAKIEEFLETGKITKLEELKEEAPFSISELTAVEGLGPRKIKKLHDEIGIKSLEDLKEAARKGKIEAIEGFGEKTQQMILENIAFAEKTGDRFLLGYVIPEAADIVEDLKRSSSRIEVAGSLRRRCETVGDIDIIAVPKEDVDLVKRFTSMDSVDRVISEGKKKSSVRLHGGIQVDLRIVEDEYFGSALCYFTGSKQHNISLRKLAQKNGWKLNEYGLFSGDDRLAGNTEEEVYGNLDLDWIPPEIREDTGEIKKSSDGELQDLLKREDIRGDLQMHSDWSDGKNTLKEMVEGCIELEHEYMAVTDHAGEIRIAGGLDLKRIRKQVKEIDRLNSQFDEIEIIKGLEANIKKDGKLDIGKEMREEVDLVLGSVHSSLRMEREQMTERLVTAVKSEEFHILAHPTCRKIQERKGIDVDLEKLFGEGAESGIIFEINAYPDRLDLNGYNVKRAIDAGSKISIGTDSHRKDHLRFIDLGVFTARKGWATKEDIINTMSYKDLMRSLQK